MLDDIQQMEDAKDHDNLVLQRDALGVCCLELLEICRSVCGPGDLIVLKSGKSNHMAICDAFRVLSWVQAGAPRDGRFVIDKAAPRRLYETPLV